MESLICFPGAATTWEPIPASEVESPPPTWSWRDIQLTSAFRSSTVPLKYVFFFFFGISTVQTWLQMGYRSFVVVTGLGNVTTYMGSVYMGSIYIYIWVKKGL